MVTYKSQEKRKAVELIDSGFFNDEGQGDYRGKPRPFVF